MDRPTRAESDAYPQKTTGIGLFPEHHRLFTLGHSDPAGYQQSWNLHFHWVGETERQQNRRASVLIRPPSFLEIETLHKPTARQLECDLAFFSWAVVRRRPRRGGDDLGQKKKLSAGRVTRPFARGSVLWVLRKAFNPCRCPASCFAPF